MIGIRTRIGIGVGRHGALLKPSYPDYFATPANIALTSGVPVTIFGDSLVNVPIVNNLTVDYTCDIGTQSGNNLALNPIDANIGDHVLTIKFKNKGVLYLTKTVNLRVYPISLNDSTTILMVGASETFLGCEEMAAGIDIGFNPTVAFVGRQGTTIKHEGLSGNSYESVVTSVNSPFMKAGALNISAYFADNSIPTPNAVIIRFGGNDVFYTAPFVATDAYLTAHVIDKSKLLIDAFLAFNPSLKIIVDLPFISESSGDGWEANYDKALYPQDTYIQNIHRIIGMLIATYDNGVYNSRVSISNSVFFLDRNNGYPKDVNGIHTNGIHPSFTADGYRAIGKGVSLELTKVYQIIPSTMNLTATWIDDFARLAWADNTGGLAQYEIYESKAGGSYTLVTTTAAGSTSYDNYTYQGVSMSFKIRSLCQGVYSDYSNTVVLSTPLVFKANMSTLSQVKITSSIMITGVLSVDWGDGVTENLTNATAKTHDYGVVKNPYYIKLSGILSNLQLIDISAIPKFYGDLSRWALSSTNLKTVFANGCGFTQLPRMNIPKIEFFYFHGNICNTAEMDSFLLFANSQLAITPPSLAAAGSYWYFHISPMGIPTGGNNNGDRLGILDKYTAVGKTLNLAVRTA